MKTLIPHCFYPDNAENMANPEVNLILRPEPLKKGRLFPRESMQESQMVPVLKIVPGGHKETILGIY